MITLIQPWYVSDKPERNAEFDFCLDKNLENPLITKIVLFCEHNCPHVHEKIEKVYIFRRAVYNEMLSYARGIVIIANTDIYFDETLQLATNIKPKQCYALSRYDLDNGGLVPFHRSDSQDAWIFKDPKVRVGDYGLGVPGCDNRVARQLLEKGYKVTNPCLSINAIHVHETNYRTYKKEDTVKGKYYLVNPTTL